MHIPVLQKEVIEYLDPKPNENFIDCTTGEGGHTLAILEKNGPAGKVLGIETDPELYKKLSSLKGRRLKLVQDSYVNLKEIIKKTKIRPLSGILFDLGLSSWHLEESGRGFSFKKNEPLDMRYNPETRAQNYFVLGRAHKICAPNPLTAEKIINFWSRQDIEKILREYGEEKYASLIAEEIIKERSIRPIKKTFQLVWIIQRAVPKRYLRGRIHFATRTFQALRIAVNGELNNLERALPQALEALKKGGRLIIISFHSLEDRIVKNFFREKAESKKGFSSEGLAKERLPLIKILTKKPVTSSFKETKSNPRSRSAKLRAAIKN